MLRLCSRISSRARPEKIRRHGRLTTRRRARTWRSLFLAPCASLFFAPRTVTFHEVRFKGSEPYRPPGRCLG
jgi:hypothetical protein